MVITPVMLNGHGIGTRRIYLTSRDSAFGICCTATTSLPWPTEQDSTFAPGQTGRNDCWANSGNNQKTDASAFMT